MPQFRKCAEKVKERPLGGNRNPWEETKTTGRGY